MLQNFLRPKLSKLFNERGAENVWFQQDGATAHTSRCSLGILREMFPVHVVSLRGDIGWSSKFPRFDTLHFFSLGLPQSQGIPTSSPHFGCQSFINFLFTT